MYVCSFSKFIKVTWIVSTVVGKEVFLDGVGVESLEFIRPCQNRKLSPQN